MPQSRGEYMPAKSLCNSPLRALLSGLAIVLGCSGSDTLNSPTAARLKKLSTMYLDYAVARNGGGPASEDVLKKHIRNSDGRTLQANGIDKNEIDSLFISERDQQPFVVIYGIGIRQISGNSKTVVAYEKTGQN